MKKHLMVLASAMLAYCCAAYAQTKAQPASYLDATYFSLSPNGKYAAGTNPYTGTLDILDIETQKNTYFAIKSETETFDLSSSPNAISNDGIVLVSTNYAGTASYIENGKLKHLPVPKGVSSSLSSAITPDGSRIAGCIGIEMALDVAEIMERPVVWNRLPDGTYSDPIELPHPKTDLTGRLPQYVLVNGISADGKTLACQIIDYAGMIPQPLIITENENGEWSYTTLGNEYLNPDNVEFPQYPGEAPNIDNYMTLAEIYAYNQAVANSQNLKQPNYTDFMTEEEKAAYEQALKDNPYANIANFMTKEEIEAYNAAVDEYYKLLFPRKIDFVSEATKEKYQSDYNEWSKRYDEFTNVFGYVLRGATAFAMNSSMVSPNGRYYALAGSDARKTLVYIYDITTGTWTIKGVEGEAVAIPRFIADNGSLIAVRPSNEIDMTSATFYAPSLDANLTPIQEAVKENDPSLYDWMNSTMLQTVWIWDDELEEDVLVETWNTGISCCDAEMKTIATWATVPSDSPIGFDLCSYVYTLPASMTTGLNAPITEVKENSKSYNIMGSRVGNDYKGIVIKNGKKTIQK